MVEGKRIIVVIPARGGSKGIKLKNLRKINGKSLTEMAIRVAQNVSGVDKIVVSTDNASIAAEAERCGISVPSYRPEALSGDRISDIQVLIDALTRAEKEDGTRYDIIIMLQPTSPLRTVKNVEDALDKLIRNDFSSIWSISETDTKAHPLKQLLIEGSNLKYYDEMGANIVARQELNSTFHRNGVVYVFTRDCIVVDNNKMGASCGYFLIDDFNISIDTEQDIDLINYYLISDMIPRAASIYL